MAGRGNREPCRGELPGGFAKSFEGRLGLLGGRVIPSRANEGLSRGPGDIGSLTKEALGGGGSVFRRVRSDLYEGRLGLFGAGSDPQVVAGGLGIPDLVYE